MGRGRVEASARWQWPLCNLALALLSLASTLFVCASASAQDGLCAVVSIQIQQKASLERQAFTAELDISNGLTTSSITDVGVNILFTDANGTSVIGTTDPNNTTASFFLRQDTPSGINATDGTGVVAASTNAVVRWLIIPAQGTGGTSPGGALYFVGATLTYTLASQTQTINILPASITVLPQPLLQLDYFLPSDVYADDPFTPQVEPSVPFTLGVRVTNIGAGAARDMRIDSAQPTIVENQQGLLIGFELLDSYVDDHPAASTLLIDFGDIAPQQSRIGRWDMETTLSGQFTDFSASFTHADSLGGALTSLVSGVINTHTLVHDVLVDLPGRDSVRDFLARDVDVLRAYESDGGNDPVTDVSPNAALGNPNNGHSSLGFPATAGLIYVQLPDPFQGQVASASALRSDGKTLPPANVWFSKTRSSGGGWSYFVDLFDAGSTGQYSITWGGTANNSSLSGFVYDDANNNGVQDNGEAAMGGVGVHLHGTAASSTIDFDTTTDAAGRYQFSGLGAGMYTLTVASVAQFVEGIANAGTAGGAGAPGAIQGIALPASTIASGYTFAKVPQAVVNPTADYVLSDLGLSATTIAVGDNATLTATLNNLGPAADSGTVALVIPAGLTVGAGVASNGTFDSTTRVWHVAALGSGAGATLSIPLSATTAGAKAITANAVVDAPATDPNPTNNASAVTLAVGTTPMLKVVKNSSGGDGTFSFIVSGGATPANPVITTTSGTGLIALDSLAAGQSVNIDEASVDGWTQTSRSCTNARAGSGAVVLPVTLAVSDDITCTFVNTAQTNVTLTQTAGQAAPLGDGTYQIDYTLKVNNAGVGSATYSLVDSLQLSPNAQTVSGSPIAHYSTNGTDGLQTALGQYPTVVASETIGVGQTDVFTLTLRFSVDPTLDATSDACNGSGSHGLFNKATLSIVGGSSSNVSACATTPQPPQINLIATASLVTDTNADGQASAGDAIGYRFDIANVGATVLGNIQLSNSRVSSVACANALPSGSAFALPNGSLIAGDSTACTGNYTVMAADVADGRLDNSASVSAVGPLGETVAAAASANYSANTAMLGQLSVVKSDVFHDTNGNGIFDIGETIGYSYVVSNTGRASLTNITVSDAKAGVSAVVCPLTTLSTGQSMLCNSSYVLSVADVQAGSVATAAVASAKLTDTNTIVSATDAHVATSGVAALLSVRKSAALWSDVNSNGLVEAGDTIRYTIVAANSGTQALTPVAVTDDKIGTALACATTTVADHPFGGALSAGDAVVCQGDYVALLGDVPQLINIADATGESPYGLALTGVASATVSVPPAPGMAATTTVALTQDGATRGVGNVNDVVTFTITITNSGNVVLSSITITDALLGNALQCGAPLAANGQGGSLAVGASAVCTGSHTVTGQDKSKKFVTNTAVITGVSALTGKTVSTQTQLSYTNIK